MSVSSMTVGGKVKFKLVLLGDQHVGKSSIIDRFINDKFQENYNSTIGIDFLVRNFAHENKTYRLQLWDTAGQQRFRALIPSYLKDSNCALIVYDIADPKTLQNTSKWLDFYNEHKQTYSIGVLIGNKSDRANESTSCKQKEISQKATSLGIPSYTISAKSGEGVIELFKDIIDRINESLKKQNCKLIQEKQEEHAGTANIILSSVGLEAQSGEVKKVRKQTCC